MLKNVIDMKKLNLFATLAAVGLVVAACDPVLIDGPEPWEAATSEEVLAGLTFTQTDADGNAAADGNYIHYNSTVGIIQWYNYKNDVENILTTGASGVITLIPKRGQSSSQTIYGRIQNADGSQTVIEKTFNVYVPADLDPELKLLLGNEGKKSWTWQFGNGITCWGNAGNSGNGAGYTANTVDGKWWGVDTPEMLLDQLSHAPGGVATGTESSAAYMELDEDGNIVAYGGDGSVVYQSTFTLENYDATRASGWEVGKLKTADPAVLFPFSINEGGKAVTEFDLMYLDPNFMTLVYTKGNGAGSWGEITYWLFKNKNGVQDALNAQDKRQWTWNTDAGINCWGNAGNSGNGAGYTAGVVDGKWWGVDTPESLLDQLNHAGGSATGAESSAAYMEFDKDGNITTYGGDGSVIYKSTYEVADYDATRASGWELGKLKTAEPAVLFPFSINENGTSVTEFDLMYVDADNMTLVYTKGNGAGSWGEITYWLFKAK